MPQGHSVDPDVVADLVRRSTSEQGLPERLEDPATIERIAVLVADELKKKKKPRAKTKTPTNRELAKEVLRARDL